MVAVACGDATLAKESFIASFRMSSFACGISHPSTLAIKSLSDDTPKSVEELSFIYNSNNEKEVAEHFIPDDEQEND